jgi:hypothetical protein
MHSPAKSIKYAKICTFEILDPILWHRETNLFRTLLHLTIIKKSLQMLEVPKPSFSVSQ